MEHVSRKLIQLRRAARAMLVGQRLSQWVTAVLAVALSLAVVDFLLRLPGWARLILGISFIIVALAWLVGKLADVLGFRPALSALALRAERVFPQLSGVLATGVEFAAAREAADSPRMRQFIDASVRQAETRLEGVGMNRLLQPNRTLRAATIAALAAGIFASLILAFPAQASIAARRWFTPLDDSAAWPRWTHIESNVTATVWPMDEPLRMQATVTKGYKPNMRTWVHYRLVAADAPATARWQFALMNDQSAGARDEARASGAPVGQDDAGEFERIIDLPAMLEASPGISAQDAIVEFYFEAGDHQTSVQQLQLVARPAVTTATLHITPPAYAKGLVEPQRIALDQQSGQRASAAAFIGSQVRFEVTLNKPVPVAGLTVASLAAGLPGSANLTFADNAQAQGESDRITFDFRLDQTLETRIDLVDKHNLASISERLYRIEAIEDKAPAVSIIAPSADEAVLASALIPLEAIAQDDVGIDDLALRAELPLQGEDQPAEGEPARTVVELAKVDDRLARLSASDELDLSHYQLSVGQTVELHARARDVFELDDVRHDPVDATPRLLRIIDESTLESRIRNELANIRNQAIRLTAQQTDLMQSPTDQALPGQQQVQRRLTDQGAQIQRLQERLERNRHEEPGLTELMKQASELLEAAQSESREAIENLQQSEQSRQTDQQAEADAREQAARKDQAAVKQALENLVNALDQGGNLAVVSAKLRDIKRQQENLAQDTRELLPRTVGQNRENLDEETRGKLDEAAQRERDLAKQAEALIKEMHASAEAIARQDQNIDSQATAAAMREAAAIAQRQGLTPTMQQAADATEENRLSEANNDQNQASNVMQEMLDELADRDKRRQEMLKRQLAKLADAIEKLIAQQEAQIERLTKATELVGLDEPLGGLRRNTISVAESARAVPETVEVGDILTEASEAQARAIVGLRELSREKASEGEAKALELLKQALAKVQEIQKQQQQEQIAQQREELRKAYEKLAKLETDLQKRTAELEQLPELNRRQKAQLAGLGLEQTAIRLEAAELRAKVSDTLLFQHLHGRIDEKAMRITTTLQESNVTEMVVDDQQYIAMALRQMAEALKQAQQDDEFADQQGGGGGRGGGAGQPPDLVPPVAELKLLRGLQEHVYERTRQVGGDGQTDVASQTLRELAAEQAELPALAERLIQKLEGAQPQPIMPEGTE